MIASLIAIIVAIALTVQMMIWPVAYNPASLSLLFITVGSLFLLAMILSNFMALVPVQRSSKRTSAKVLEIFSRDPKQRWAKGGIVLFIFYSFLAPFYSLEDNTHYLLILWLLLLGVAIDLFRAWSHQVLQFCNPAVALKLLIQTSTEKAKAGKEEALFPWIDALAETAIGAIDHIGTSLAIDAMSGIGQMTQAYLQAATEERIHLISSEERAGHKENVSYALFYLFDRMETIFNKAVAKESDMATVSVITNLGKVAIFTAKHDPTMAKFPLHYIGRFAKRAVALGMQDVGIKTCFTFQEVAKILAEENIFTPESFQDLFMSLLKNLEELSQELFRVDKTIEVVALIQPFKEIQRLLDYDNITGLPDAGSVKVAIDNIIEDFQALQQVMVNLPNGKSAEE